MNILQINSVCGTGSTGRIATDLHSILLAQGHSSTVAFGRGLSNNCDQAIRVGNLLGNVLHLAQTRLFDKHGLGSGLATKSFINQIKTLNPKIIHLHNLHGYFIHIGMLFEYLKQANIPVIWTLHDCWSFTGHCAYFDFVGCERWQTECHHCPAKKQYPKSIFFDSSRANFRQKKILFSDVANLTIVTPSRWLAVHVEKSYLQNYPVEVINNGIDLDVFQPTQNGFRKSNNLENIFIILGVASIWEDRKGLLYFLELSKYLKTDEKIVLVGLNENQMKSLPSNIIGICKTNNVRELAEIYSTVDIFINPTLEDNFPTTNIEALACGTPVATFNTGGSPECLDDQCGFVLERGDLQGLLEVIEKVKGLGKDTFTIHCRTRAKHFDKKARFAEYIDLYQRVLSNNP